MANTQDTRIPPLTGSWNVGDQVIDQGGRVWRCTVAGTPGSWAPQTPPASAGFTNPMSAAGDTIVGDTSGVAIRTAKGADNSVWTMDPATHLPVWGAPAATTAFTSGGDMLGSRLKDTDYTNGSRRRLVMVSAHITPSAGNDSFLGYRTTVAGAVISSTAYDSAVGSNIISVGDPGIQGQVCFVVDPGAVYRIVTTLGAGGGSPAVTVRSWLEADW